MNFRVVMKAVVYWLMGALLDSLVYELVHKLVDAVVHRLVDGLVRRLDNRTAKSHLAHASMFDKRDLYIWCRCREKRDILIARLL